MSKAPKPFEFELTNAEIEEIRNAQGTGGFQALQERLIAELENGSKVTFDDAQLGEVIRYMTQYKGGGFQGRLRAAFERSLREQLGF